MVSLYLHGKAYKWWQQLNALYEKDHKRLGWTTFIKEFLAQWRPSSSMSHYKQHANPEEQRRDAPKVESHNVAGLEVFPSSEEMAIEEEVEK